MAWPLKPITKESVAKMQIRQAPGENWVDIGDRVREYWRNGYPNAWTDMAEWEDARAKAMQEIFESIKGMSDKDQEEQFKIKMEQWNELNPVPKEFDDMRRRNAAMGIKPINFEKYVNNRGTGNPIKFSKESIEKADKDNESLQDHIDKMPIPKKKMS